MTGTATAFGVVDDPAVQAVARHAQALVGDGTRVGLGSGRAAQAFVAALGARVRDGLRVVAVAASEGPLRTDLQKTLESYRAGVLPKAH